MQYEEVEALLDPRKSPTMEELRKTVIKEITDLFAPFQKATDMLEKEKQPTLSLILLCKTKLEKHLTLGPVDLINNSFIKIEGKIVSSAETGA
ncbi:hypothetical protein HPB50_020645 [Hyalomma asiaticum]|uniref:Uncharacterized protein n=1 Tax=Hyalomma asiaticum TaxID=266040 RepID=A0ACB7S846_HYAAI|nr:hypothetical protein HPB50_020645 [Hyalomma asiaticum]